MSIIQEITACRICDTTELDTIFDLGVHALSCRFPKDDEEKTHLPESSLVLVRCTKCHLLQLKHNVDGDALYKHNYGYRSGLNNTMITHLTFLVSDILSTVTLKKDDIVIDIGSNDCTLLKAYPEYVRRIGIDPTGEQFREYYPDTVELIPTYFTAAAVPQNVSAKVITSISMFYDLPNPVQFAKDIAASLTDDGIWCTEQSYCVTMLNRNSFDTICHEHLEYYMLEQLQWIAEAAGLCIFEVSLNDCNGGSFRLKMCKKEAFDKYRNADKLAYIDSLSQAEKNITNEELKNFVKRCDDIKVDTMHFLTSQKIQGKTIWLYGASTKGNTLLQYYGLDNTIITAAAERNVQKYGCVTPRSNIPIVSEQEMREAKPDFLLVLPWHFRKEFVEREKEYLENGGTIIFPLPYFEVIKKTGEDGENISSERVLKKDQ